LLHVVHDPPKPLRDMVPGLPAGVVATVERALEKDPNKRFADVASFVSALTGASLEPFEPIAGLREATRQGTPETVDGASADMFGDGDVSKTSTAGRVPRGILFGDMKGSTEEAEYDERSTVHKLRQYERIINETAKGFGPSFYKVKTEGDGFMATFATAH